MHGLDRLLSKPSQLQVLRVLYRHREEALTGREIERQTGLSNRATMMALEQLTELSAVHREITPRAYLFQINLQHYLVGKGLKGAFEAEDHFWEDLRKLIRRNIHPRPIALVVTGPLAREESLRGGRMDLNMLFATGRDRIRAYPCLEELAAAVQDRYAIQIDTNLLDMNNMEREEFAIIWRRIAREGILLFGQLP